MQNSALISVIIPTYNAGEYLAQCIENLLFQTYKNLEVIVVDDGSTDDTSEVVKQFSTVNYIYQENSGVSVARNTGIDAASGEFIHFMDADDLVSLEFFERMLRFIIDTNADMSCCGFVFERFPSQSQKIEHSLLLSKTEDKILMTNVCNYGACWKYLFRVSFLKERNLRFEPGVAAGQDRMFSIQAVYFARKIVLVPDVVYYYKNRENSTTASRSLVKTKRRHTYRKIAEKFVSDFAEKYNFSLDTTLNHQRFSYKILGIPIVTKKTFHPGKTKWYFLFIPIFMKKEVDK